MNEAERDALQFEAIKQSLKVQEPVS
jgi:hypothetical protein